MPDVGRVKNRRGSGAATELEHGPVGPEVRLSNRELLVITFLVLDCAFGIAGRSFIPKGLRAFHRAFPV